MNVCMHVHIMHKYMYVCMVNIMPCDWSQSGFNSHSLLELFIQLHTLKFKQIDSLFICFHGKRTEFTKLF